MRRRIAVILLLLFGGAIVNVAVALSCMVIPHVALAQRLVRDAPNESQKAWWARASPRRQPVPSVDWSIDGHAFGLHVTEMIGNRHFERVLGTDAVVETRTLYDRVMIVTAGWPWRSFSSERWEHGIGPRDRRAVFDSSQTQGVSGDVERGGVSFERPSWLGQPGLRMLAYRPIVSGFLLNTLAYAMLLWLFALAFVTTRGKGRRRRGLCEKCAYPIGVSPVCTECGAAVAARSQRHPHPAIRIDTGSENGPVSPRADAQRT